MKNWFSERIVLTTNLDIVEVNTRLNTIIESEKLIRIIPKSKKYEGSLSKHEFWIQSINIGNRRSRPQITGKFFKAENSTVIEARIWFLQGRLISLGAGILVFFTLFAILLINAIIEHRFNAGVFLPLIPIILVIGITVAILDSEIEKFTETMQELLNAKVQNEEE